MLFVHGAGERGDNVQQVAVHGSLKLINAGRDLPFIIVAPQWLLDGKPSPTGRLTFETWRQYDPNLPLLESGLLGQVTLHTAEIIPAK